MIANLKKLVQLVSFRILLVIVLILTGILQFFLMLDNVRGVTYDIQLTELAPETIRSVKTVEDNVKTELDKDHAEAAVEPVYVFKEDIANQRAFR